MKHQKTHDDNGSRRQDRSRGEMRPRRVSSQAKSVGGQKKGEYHWLEVSNLSGSLNLKGQEAADYLRKIGLL